MIKENYPEYYLWNEYPADRCVAIRKVGDRWGILGNFAPIRLMISGVAFDNSEQLFQMMKFSDEETLLAIYGRKGLPLKWAAKAGERRGLRRSDWGSIVIDAMKFCLEKKYKQSAEFRQVLKETSELFIVEDQTGLKSRCRGLRREADTWGVVRRENRYVGSNLMGRLLMELRDCDGNLEYHLPENILDFLQYLR